MFENSETRKETLKLENLQERISKAISSINATERQATLTKNKFKHNSRVWNTYLIMYFDVLFKDCEGTIKALNYLIKQLHNSFGNGLVDLFKIHQELLIYEFNAQRMKYSLDAISNTLDEFSYYID